MTRRAFNGLGVFVASLPIAITTTACAGSEETSCGATSVKQALYFGNKNPSAVELDSFQRLSIVMVTDDIHLEGNFCTGTLISERWVITAKHCQGSSPLLVAFGSDATNPLLVLETAKAVAHPTLDLMLLELRRPAIVQSLGLRPISRLDESVSKSWLGARAELAGFGQTETLGFGELRFVDEPITLVDDTTWRVDGSGDSGGCFGDSGGPLLVSDGGTTKIAGVLSKGSASCVNQDLYVRLDNVRAWFDFEMAMQTPARGCESLPRAGECAGRTAIWCSNDRLEATFCAAADECSPVPDVAECALCK